MGRRKHMGIGKPVTIGNNVVVAAGLLAVFGGSIGAWFGMKVWHHKTMHKKFKHGVPIIFILQVALALWIVCKMAQTPMPIQ